MVDQFDQRAHRQHVDPVDEGGLLGVRGGHHDLRVPGRRSRENGRQDAPDGTHRPVEAQLAEEHEVVDGGLGHRFGRRQDRGGEREVETASLLRHRGGREPDRDPP